MEMKNVHILHFIRVKEIEEMPVFCSGPLRYCLGGLKRSLR